jgi:hypothetical protein
MNQISREDLRGTDFFDRERDAVAFSSRVLGKTLHVPRENKLIARVDEFSSGIHAERRLIPAKLDNNAQRDTRDNCTHRQTHLDDDDPFIESDGDFVRISSQRHTPRPLQRIAQRIFQPIRVAVPDLDRPVLAPADDDRQVRMKDRKRGVIGVAFHRLDAALAKIIPYFDRLVVARRHEVRPVRPRIEIDIVDPLVVSVHREVGIRRTEGPHLDRPIETGRCKRVGVFRVKSDVHDIVRVAVVYLSNQEKKHCDRIHRTRDGVRKTKGEDIPEYTSIACPNPKP